MNFINKIKCVLFASLIFACLPSWGWGDKAEGAVDDATITINIKERLNNEKTLSGMNFDVQTVNGQVTIIGTTQTDEQASTVIEIAESTSGVKKVQVTKLTVKDSKQPFEDTVITARVKGTFIREKLYEMFEKEGAKDAPPVFSIHVETKNGIVYLTGTAENQAQADLAVKLAQSVENVKSVDSKIMLKTETTARN